MVTAGGDGSMISILTKAKEMGVDLSDISCCALPYGTGNDLSRITGWGGSPNS